MIVVDDGSRDPAAVAAAAAAAGARCVHRAVNGGPAAARNTGLAAVGTPLVAFLDSDCVPAPGWLSPLLPHFADPAVAAAAPRIVPHTPGARSGGYRGRRGPSGRPGRVSGLAGAVRGLQLDPGHGGGAEHRAAGCQGAVRAGGGPRRPRSGGRGRVRRAHAAGGGRQLRLAAGRGRLARPVRPAATVAHQHRVRLRGWFTRRMQYGTSAAPLELRHPGTLPAVAMSGWSATAWAAAALGHPGAGAGITAAATALLARRLAPVTGDPWPVAARLAAGGTVAAAGCWAARCRGRGGRWRCPPRSRCPGCGCRWPRWSSPRPCSAGGSGARRWDSARYVSARLLDDVAYSIGVWQGCLRHRTARPLLPRLTWRGRPFIKWTATLIPTTVPVKPVGQRLRPPGHNLRA